MGIHEANKFFKKETPEAFMSIPFNTFRGKAIAIDIYGFIYKYMFPATKKYSNKVTNIYEGRNEGAILREALNSIMIIIIDMIEACITPVCIFDGERNPHKGNCHKKRQEQVQVNLNQLYIKQNEIIQKGEYATQDDLNEYQYYLGKIININIDAIKFFRDTIESIGIKCLTAKHDGEVLCSALNREAEFTGVAGVWSIDTDNYALGTPIMIKEFTDGSNKTYVDIVRVETMLRKLGCTIDFLRDFCIMCGTDFNERMPGIGPSKSIKLLRLFWSIDNIPEQVCPNKYMLNHNETREDFAYVPTGLKKTDLNIDWNMFSNNRQMLINICSNKTACRFLYFSTPFYIN